MPRRRQIIICIPGILATFCVILRYLKITGSALSGIWGTSYFMGMAQPFRHSHTLFSDRSEAQGAASLGRISRDEHIVRRARKA